MSCHYSNPVLVQFDLFRYWNEFDLFRYWNEFRCLRCSFATDYLQCRSPVLERTTRAGLEDLKGKESRQHHALEDRFVHGVIMLQRPLTQLSRGATGHHSLLVLRSVSNPLLVQLDNIEHFVNEIVFAFSEGSKGLKASKIKPRRYSPTPRWSQRDRASFSPTDQFGLRDQFGWPRGSGRHESRRFQASKCIFVFPVWYGVIVLLQPYKDDVYLFSKELDEKAATLHFPALGAAVNVLEEQSALWCSSIC